MTVECPYELEEVPTQALDLYESKNYWILKAFTVFHEGRYKELKFSVKDLKVGDTIGCSIHKDGTLHYYVNGKDRGVSWDGKLPINEAVYGFVDINGRVTKIRSLFYYGKCKSMLTWIFCIIVYIANQWGFVYCLQHEIHNCTCIEAPVQFLYDTYHIIPCSIALYTSNVQ